MCSDAWVASDPPDCRPAMDLCTRRPFSFPNLRDADGWKEADGYTAKGENGELSVSPLAEKAEDVRHFYLPAGDAKAVTIKVGDVDLDGFPDLLVLAAASGGGGPTAQIFANVGALWKATGPPPDEATNELRLQSSWYANIWNFFAGSQLSDSPSSSFSFSAFSSSSSSAPPGPRFFRKFLEFSLAENGQQIAEAAFFDLHEDGALDLLAFGWSNSSASSPSSSSSFSRNFLVAFSPGAEPTVTTANQGSHDNVGFFFKAVVTNGAAQISSSNPTAYGSSYHGPSLKMTVTDVEGYKSVRSSALLPQCAHTPLGLPYSLIGLGRTNNYIPELHLGIPSNCTLASQLWITLIPNSHVVVNPMPRNDPPRWPLQLSVSPSNQFTAILMGTICTLLLLGVVIFFLHRKETIQDSEQQRGFRAQLFITFVG
eukprot:GHVT01034494.1.p1 GENE.GHVT01034494.1~~GHVT01034494.1.p1  ORF type:complete len:427 (-),score=92.31 GHVT01034494.1:437-1717(-)